MYVYTIMRLSVLCYTTTVTKTRTEMGLDRTGNRLIFVLVALFCGFMCYSVAVDKQTRIIKKLKI